MNHLPGGLPFMPAFCGLTVFQKKWTWWSDAVPWVAVKITGSNPSTEYVATNWRPSRRIESMRAQRPDADVQVSALELALVAGTAAAVVVVTASDDGLPLVA